MRRRITWVLAAASLLVTLSLATSASADAIAGSAALSDQPHVGIVVDHEREAARAAGGEEPEGIINWVSLDYGPNAKDPTHRGWPPPFAFAFLNFAVFAAILYKLLGPWLRNKVISRHDDVRHNLDEASRLRAEAQKMLTEYQARVAGADEEIAKLLSELRAQAESDKQRIIAAAKADAERLKADAERRVTAEIDAARLLLRREVVEQSVRIAQQLLVQQTGPDDQRRMAERYVGDLEAGQVAKPGSAS